MAKFTLLKNLTKCSMTCLTDRHYDIDYKIIEPKIIGDRKVDIVQIQSNSPHFAFHPIGILWGNRLFCFSRLYSEKHYTKQLYLGELYGNIYKFITRCDYGPLDINLESPDINSVFKSSLQSFLEYYCEHDKFTEAYNRNYFDKNSST